MFSATERGTVLPMASGERPGYDAVGHGYAATRRPDPRIRERIERALGDAATVVNVGAGSGSYEPVTTVLAVEPSAVMAAQRPTGMAPVAITTADRIPLAEGAVDAALAVLTIHHWNDLEASIAELRRVARRIVILTWDASVIERFWLFRDYLPAAAALDRELEVPIERLERLLDGARVEPVPVPHDCVDGFAGAFWRRPEVYLDAHARANITSLARLEGRLDEGLDRLAADLASGAWHEHNAGLLALDELDVGYRLVVSGGGDHGR